MVESGAAQANVATLPGVEDVVKVRHYPAGEQARELKAGYFLLTHGKGTISKLIRFGQGWRFRGKKRPYAYWNHAALVLDDDGRIAEALTKGVLEQKLEKYKDVDYYLVQVDASPEDREHVVRFAESVLEARYRYSWIEIVTLALAALTASKYVVGKVGTAICSGFVSSALVRTGEIFPVPPDYMTPADLAMHYDVRPE